MVLGVVSTSFQAVFVELCWFGTVFVHFQRVEIIFSFAFVDYVYSQALLQCVRALHYTTITITPSVRRQGTWTWTWSPTKKKHKQKRTQKKQQKKSSTCCLVCLTLQQRKKYVSSISPGYLWFVPSASTWYKLLQKRTHHNVNWFDPVVVSAEVRMSFFQELSRRHAELKAKIHGTRIPLGPNGVRFMKAVYIATPIILGALFMEGIKAK